MPKTKKLFLAFLIFLFGFIFPAKIFAEGEGIKISPVVIEDMVQPGQRVQKTIKVTNESEGARTLYPYLKDFSADGESGMAKLLPPGSGDESSLSNWIEIDVNGFSFNPHEEKEIPFYVNVPQSAGPGGHYGAIVFGTQPPKVNVEGGERGAAIAISQQTGALVLLQVAGDANEEAEVREFTTDNEIYGTPFDVNFLTRIENKGNVHIKPAGSIKITNFFGKEAAVLRFNEKLNNVLPKSIRKYNYNWKGDIGFGRYKASLILSYGVDASKGGQGMQSIYQEKYFWIIPWKIVVPLVLGIVFLATLAYLFLKFYKNRAVKRAIEAMGGRDVRYMRKSHSGHTSSAHLGLIISIILLGIFILSLVLYFVFLA